MVFLVPPHPASGIAAERLDLEPLIAGNLHHARHELTPGSGAAQGWRGLDIGNAQRRALAHIGGKHGLTADVQLKAASIRVVSDRSCHTETSPDRALGFRSSRDDHEI